MKAEEMEDGQTKRDKARKERQERNAGTDEPRRRGASRRVAMSPRATCFRLAGAAALRRRVRAGS